MGDIKEKNIGEILDEILEKRAEKAKDKENQEKELKEKKEHILQLGKIYDLISQLEEKEQETMCGSKEMAEELKNSKGIMDDCLKACEKAIDSVNTLKIRFQRKTIDLIVIGKMGAGKSKFLQSASCLNNDCIPSYDGPSCTGVSSIIENIDDTLKTEAHFIFKTKEEVMEDINRETQNFAVRLHKLMPEIPMANIKIVTGLEPEEISAGFKVLKEKADEMIAKSSPDSITKTYTETMKGMIEDREKEYIDAKKREEWFPYIGSSESVNEKFKEGDLKAYKEGNKYHYVLSDPKKIKLFVSKHEESDNKYHSYIAVKEAVIKTHITGIDGRVRLVDTVGIGDPTADTISRVQEAVSKESDGVIFLFSISGARIDTEAGPDYEDTVLLQTLREIFREHKKADAGHWMAFLLNHRKKANVETDNRFFSKKYMNIIENSYNTPDDNMFGKNGIQYREVLDVSNPDEVNVMLKEFLRQIAKNLDSIDERLEQEEKELCKQFKEQEQKLKLKLRNIRINTPKKQDQNYIYTLVNERLEKLGSELKKYRLALIEEGEKNQNEPSFLKQRIAIVRKLKEGEYLDEIHTDLESMINTSCEKNIYIADARLETIKSLKKAVRKIATIPSEKQKQAEEDYKKTIAEKFVQCLQIDLTKLKNKDNATLCENDIDFFEEIGEAMLNGISGSEEIIEIFYSLNRFGLNEMNILTKALFYHHAEKHLTDDPYQNISEQSDFSEEKKENSSNESFWGFWESCKSEDQNQREDFISESDKKKMKAELQNKLDIFIQEVEKDTGDETYLVEYFDQMNEELYNFMQILNKEYRERWHMVFHEMREQGVLKEDKENEKRQETLRDISEKVTACLSKGQSL